MKFAQHVSNELARHPGVIASLNEQTGAVNTFLLPNTGLPSVTELEAERDRLQTMIDRASGNAERTKLRRKLDLVESDLRRARGLAEADRRHGEREQERPREQGRATQARASSAPMRAFVTFTSQTTNAPAVARGPLNPFR
jgi:hypothetical protein